ncbi:AraC family transcriptional regulator [Stappia sp. MMSF_3263]|uniref:AraC family transcriptional regulator n=1 Tax=Stappia sp. MMSF_3263 TaxID=3046693 RepID=UPI00273E08C2|nr:AraC family transcriptional regulator [Stappia sp. MMSF_3263]
MDVMQKRVDRLSALIDRFRIDASVLHAPLAGRAASCVNLFLITEGMAEQVSRPRWLVFRTGGAPTGGVSVPPEGDVAVAARVDLGGEGSPLAMALPAEVRVDLEDAPALAAVSTVLLEEVERPRCGGKAIVDRLCEIVVIRFLRHAIETGRAENGLIAGLGHPQIMLALVAMHEAPERRWKLEDLAGLCGMSRTAFATTFRDVVGRTPGAYLQDWRLGIARQEIGRGGSLKTVAGRVGFSSAAAFSRAFSRQFGHAPSACARAG